MNRFASSAANHHWRPVPLAGLLVAAAFTAAVFGFTVFGDGWVPLVDSANLAVHEAGHPLMFAFGERFSVYGGTLAQLAFPLICIYEFRRRGWTTSCGLSGLWLGESLLNVARYAADARAMQLPLIGFSAHPLHDWNVILARWGLLHRDALVADGFRTAAWIVIAGALWFLWCRRMADAAAEATAPR